MSKCDLEKTEVAHMQPVIWETHDSWVIHHAFLCRATVAAAQLLGCIQVAAFQGWAKRLLSMLNVLYSDC